MLKDLTVNNFVNELASNSPAPGGGSVAALAACLATSLSSMVFNLTVGKKAYNEYDDKIKEQINNALKEAELNKNLFITLMDKDTEEFMALMSSFKLPKTTEDEKKLRSEKIQEGYKGALDIPYEVAKQAFKTYNNIYIACSYGNKNAISDAGVAALLLQAAIESAVLNVKINLTCIKDANFVEEVRLHCDNIVRKGKEKRDEILSIVDSKIGL